eukprot:1166114-Pleurochrysis_carterae.AAC.2
MSVRQRAQTCVNVSVRALEHACVACVRERACACACAQDEPSSVCAAPFRAAIRALAAAPPRLMLPPHAAKQAPHTRARTHSARALMWAGGSKSASGDREYPGMKGRSIEQESQRRCGSTDAGRADRPRGARE